jgi:hypothetical protein
MQINLLPKQSPVKTYLTIGVTSAAALLLLGNVWIAVQYLQTDNEIETINGQLQQVQRKLPLLQTEADRAKKMQESANQYQALQRWSFLRSDLKEEVQLFSALLPVDGYLLVVNYADERVYELQAILPDLESVATYLRQLETHKEVAGVAVKSLSEQKGAANQPAAAPGAAAAAGAATTEYKLELHVIVSRTTK